MNDEPPSPGLWATPVAAIDLDVEPVWEAAGLGLQELAEAAIAAVFEEEVLAQAAGEVEVALRFTNDATVAELNATWRGQAKPTDVLSFPATAADEPAPPPGVPWLLGDVVLAFETCARDAEALARPLAAHVSHLVVHGLLHLLHHDHQEPGEAAAMEALEVRILARLGIDDPYRDRPLITENL
ncbi:MAG: rRNA maturation RNase YbeY [Geminicoccaceae bacterium]|nr:MAG: rRNA maturation RNase YbeY [Geminicoccaceae bacterium]